MTLNFEITGNQETAKGNPIPYLRMTQNDFWKASARRYHAWQNWVVKAYRNALVGSTALTAVDHTLLGSISSPMGKPIKLEGRKAYMHILISWANNRRGDCDNIFKGIADALFENDKNVAGSFDYEMAEDGVGRVQVQIIID